MSTDALPAGIPFHSDTAALYSTLSIETMSSPSREVPINLQHTTADHYTYEPNIIQQLRNHNRSLQEEVNRLKGIDSRYKRDNEELRAIIFTLNCKLVMYDKDAVYIPAPVAEEEEVKVVGRLNGGSEIEM